jgi:hypothetical protein
VEISQVPDNFQFGEHGNHYHIPVHAAKEHLCLTNPIISEDNNDSSDIHDLRY